MIRELIFKIRWLLMPPELKQGTWFGMNGDFWNAGSWWKKNGDGYVIEIRYKNKSLTPTDKEEV